MMNNIARITLVISALGLSAIAAKADPGKRRELGNPIIRNFTVEEFAKNAEGEVAQIWSIIEDQRGVKYFGLGKNVVQFDGQHWNPIPIPSGPAYGLAIDQEGTIYVAMVGNFGYLAGDDKGTYCFVSLLDKLPKAQRKVTTAWSVHATTHGVYFVSPEVIYRYYKGTIEQIKDKATYIIGFSVDNDVYCRQEDNFVVVHEGRIHHIAELKTGVVAFPGQGHKALIFTRSSGMVIHDHDAFVRAVTSATPQVKSDSFSTPFPTEVDDYVREHRIYCGAKINDTQYAIGTRTGGIAIIDNEGHLVQIVNRNRGLIDDTIWALWADRAGNLWAGTNSGIAQIMLSSPITVFNPHNGLDSTVNFIKRHKGIIYFSTFQGIYFLPSYEMNVQNDRYTIEPIANTSRQSFALIEHQGELLAASDDTVFQIRGSTGRELITLPDTVLTFASTKRFPDHIFLGLLTGIAILKVQTPSPAASAVQAHELKVEIVQSDTLGKLPSSFYELVSDNHGDLWASSGDKGVYQIHWLGEDIGNFKVFHYGIEDGLPDLAENYVYWVNNQLLMGTKRGIYSIKSAPKNEKPAKIVEEKHLNEVFKDRRVMIWRIRVDAAHHIWLGNSDRLGVVRPLKDGSYVWDTKVAAMIRGKIENFYIDENNILWIGCDKELYRYDATKPKDYEQNYSALIRKVVSGNKHILLEGEYFEALNETTGRFTRAGLVQSPKAVPILKYEDNTISFEFAAAFYERTEKTKFKYQLEGFDKQPSEWAPITTKEYTNLPEGTYAFQVRAKNIYGHESSPAIYTFKIMAPWYRTIWAYLAYLVLGIAFLAGCVRVYTWRLIAAKRKLERIVKEKTKEVVSQKDEIEQQKSALEIAYHQVNEIKEALWGEMELAKKIQTVLLPKDPRIPGYEIIGYMQTADEVGGDYYDVINGAGKSWLVVGDVSGHGVPAGLVMMMVQTAIHTTLEERDDPSPRDILRMTNRVIYENIAKLGEDKYMTITVLCCGREGTVHFSGLHLDILVWRASERQIEVIPTNGIWIGLVDEISEMLEVETFSLHAGDLMLLFTDGIVEARNKNGQLYGDEKLCGIFESCANLSIEELTEQILDSLKEYILDDDMTMLIAKKTD